MTPTARSLAFLRRCGHSADVVERWIPLRDNVRRDLFGFIDVVAVRRGSRRLGRAGYHVAERGRG